MLPESAEEVAAVLAWCYEHDVPLVPRGGGTGYAGGAVPRRRRRARAGAAEPRARVRPAAVADARRSRSHDRATCGGSRARTASCSRPTPARAEQSQIGGNIATNAGGPHAFKYGVTGTWVTGLEAVVPPGELVARRRRDAQGRRGLRPGSLLIGSEGTLGIVTAAWLRLFPAPEAALPVVAFYAGTPAGCARDRARARQRPEAAALEYLDGGTLAAAGASFPVGCPTARLPRDRRGRRIAPRGARGCAPSWRGAARRRARGRAPRPRRGRRRCGAGATA